ncbi:Na+/H+ antiporter NhaA [Maridesulfovibrio hydrothermalis]|uniref:Na(+)/H(+) antiporter NhaA n=1 Tax=Maridesulfovibrio hydrothermalis AM13 = DSM 14728 TaxID=1121451 RepID=L0R8G6_9BACT|nr:Na+/H+ antiporter NhaA [Maridesulfovibrio hydrothermalis]CCO23053.1 Na(+)/H(+) antiporter nhaA [Maridesulfovibrio hydrothermalis AM13 = DSM 14728]
MSRSKGLTRDEPRTIDKMLHPFYEFVRVESSGGLVLIAATVIALIWANSPWGDLYEAFKNVQLTVGAGEFILSKPAILWINDGLMAVFFFLVGLEIKREIMVGELNSFRQASLPLFAAIGGMVVPALVYAFFNNGTPSADGWGIPMATDIAFSLGVLSMLGDRVPLSLKIFLTAVAIVDDIGAILVIAVFYSTGVSLWIIGIGLLFFLCMILLNKMGIRAPLPYLFFGTLMWFAFLKSGVHATVAGVLAAMTIPATTRICCGDFVSSMRGHLSEYDIAGGESPVTLSNKQMLSSLGSMNKDVLMASPPLKRIEHNLHYFVAFAIMPVFALANAGINFNADGGGIDVFHPVSMGIFFGLIVGKVIGICLASWFVIKIGFADMPSTLVPRHFLGASLLASIGFTMSIFIATLAWDASSPFITDAKFSILTASAVAGVLGFLVLRSCPHSAQRNSD